MDGLCLSPPGSHQDDVAGLQDGADALGEAVLRDSVDIPVEEASVVPAGLTGQCFDPGTGGERRAGFVERDVPVGADAQNLKINTSRFGDGFLVRRASAL